jgi:hypothetical protein
MVCRTNSSILPMKISRLSSYERGQKAQGMLWERMGKDTQPIKLKNIGPRIIKDPILGSYIFSLGCHLQQKKNPDLVVYLGLGNSLFQIIEFGPDFFGHTGSELGQEILGVFEFGQPFPAVYRKQILVSFLGDG